MHHIKYLATIVTLVTGSVASCNHDNLYSAIDHYQSTVSKFCETYLASSSISTACHLASHGPSRISSACSCLTEPSDVCSRPTTPTSTFNPSTCARGSISVCPTPYDPCCAYICAEAQVPFDVCSPENETVLAQCSKCPLPTSFTASPVNTVSTEQSTSRSTASITSTPTTLLATTCTGRFLTTAACPTPYDPCCAWNCEEAQVPFNVCSQTDGSGEFAVCTKCSSPVS